MRLLHLHTGNIFGGIESMLVTLARARVHVPAGAEMTFALVFEGRLSRELESAGAAPALLGEARLRRPDTVARARRRLRRVLDDTRPDFVIVHLPWTQTVFAPEIARAGCGLITWLHAPSAGLLHRWASMAKPAAVICNSAFTASFLSARYLRAPHAVIHCPLAPPPPSDGAERTRIRAALDTAQDDVVVFQASRLEPWKGHEVHLRALASVRDVAGWTVWMAGGADRPDEHAYEQMLRALAAELGIASRVRFIGERTDVARLMAASDIYCQPNTGAEPFGLAFVEALYAGIPVIAGDAGGAREIVTSECGVLVAPGSVDAASAALRGLIGDGDRRRALGSAGPARAAALCDPRRQLRVVDEFLGRLRHRRGAA